MAIAYPTLFAFWLNHCNKINRVKNYIMLEENIWSRSSNSYEGMTQIKNGVLHIAYRSGGAKWVKSTAKSLRLKNFFTIQVQNYSQSPANLRWIWKIGQCKYQFCSFLIFFLSFLLLIIALMKRYTGIFHTLKHSLTTGHVPFHT